MTRERPDPGGPPAGTLPRGADPIDLAGLEPGPLFEALRGLDVKPYVGRQLFHWIYGRREHDFEAMTSLGLALRRALARGFRLGFPPVEERVAAPDFTLRFGYRLADGERTESVLIPGEDGRATLCVSSQVGCALGCTFCVSGLLGVRRNLSVAEMVGQVLAMLREAGPVRRVNLVFMGMGEGLLNLDNLLGAVRILAHDDGPGISLRRMTVSTAGHVPALERFGAAAPRPRLAVSLNATTDRVRSRIMPINRAWPLEALLDACRRFPLKRGERITFEYVLLDGENDAPEDAHRLPRLLHGIPAKLNLIPWNPAQGLAHRAPPPARVERFAEILYAHALTVTVRRRRGADAGAACGQLALRRPAALGVPVGS